MRGAARTRRTAAWLGALPYLVLVAVFVVLPVGANVWSSFHTDGTLSPQNLGKAVQGQFFHAFRTTVELSAATALAGGLLGLLLAWALVGEIGVPRVLRSLAQSFTTVASQSGGIPLAFAFVATLGSQGLVTRAISQVSGIPFADRFHLASSLGLFVVYLYFQVPLMAILVVPALKGLRREWYEAATALGASRGTYLKDVALPILAPAIGGSLLLLFANAFAAYATAAALTGSSINLVPILVGVFLSGNVVFDESFAAALVTWMMVVICACLGLRGVLTRRTNRWLR